MQAEVTKQFDKELTELFEDQPNVLSHLIYHERKPKVIESLCSQIKLCEREAYSLKFDKFKYRYVIKELAKYWASNAMRYAEEQAISRIEKQRRIDEANRIDEAQGLMDEMETEALSTSVTSRPGGVAT